MSWRFRVSPPEDLDRVSAAHDEAWREIEARSNIRELDFQAESDRLGDIIVELWKRHSDDDNLHVLAIGRFDSERKSDEMPARD